MPYACRLEGESPANLAQWSETVKKSLTWEQQGRETRGALLYVKEEEMMIVVVAPESEAPHRDTLMFPGADVSRWD